MLAFAYFALFGIPSLAVLLILKHRGSPRAVAVAMVGGWLAMPLLTVSIGGLPDMNKATVLDFSVLLSTWVARLGHSAPTRLKWFDLPMIVFCLTPLVSSLSNDLGGYDGISAVFGYSVVFGFPYAIGRMALVDRNAFVEMGRVLLFGAVLYAPLCLIESRLAPQMHEWVYGMPGRQTWERVEFYGPMQWKASVFLRTHLELTSIMGVGFLFGWWSWRTRRVQAISGIPMSWLLSAAMLATLMGKSLGGVCLTLTSACVLWLGRRFQTRLFLAGMLAIAPVYIVTRAAGVWDGRALVQFVAENISERRAASLEFRMINEDILVEKALQRPLLGWSGWGRNRVYDEEGKDVSITDGLWVLHFGCLGLLGLTAWLLALLLPSFMALSHMSARERWLDPQNAIVICCAVVLPFHAIDCLANAMANPIYFMLAGGLCSWIANEKRKNGRGAQGVRPSENPANDSGELHAV